MMDHRRQTKTHPALIGSTKPMRIGEEDCAYARRLFRDIVAGWEASMRETRGLEG